VTTTALPRIGDWSGFDELADLQHKELPRVLERASASPFYRDRLAGTPASDFGSVRPTTKQDLRDGYPFGLLAVPKTTLATYHESSGSAGQPTSSYYTDEDWVDLAERYARKWIGMSAEDTFLVRTPYALMVTGHLAQAGARLHGATVVPADNRSLATPCARVVRLLHDLDVTLSWSMAAETLMWAASAKQLGYRPGRDFPSLRALFVGGDPVSPARRRRISELWGVPVIEEYGSTEVGSMAGECPEGTLHLWADRFLFEVYDPDTGRMSREGVGQLVVTPLFRQAMPLVRYNQEDNVEVSYQDCGCGWRLPTLRVLGRTAFGYPVGNARVTQDRLEQLVFALPIERDVLFWRAKAYPERLSVEIEVPAEHRDVTCADLTRDIDAELGVPCEVRGLAPGTLVPREVLTGNLDVVKPRSLFGPDEDWGKAIVYQ
jgi:phenylacetate-CoA ligase